MGPSRLEAIAQADYCPRRGLFDSRFPRFGKRESGGRGPRRALAGYHCRRLSSWLRVVGVLPRADRERQTQVVSSNSPYGRGRRRLQFVTFLFMIALSVLVSISVPIRVEGVEPLTNSPKP